MTSERKANLFRKENVFGTILSFLVVFAMEQHSSPGLVLENLRKTSFLSF
jgi:hypothetical protein